MKNFKGKIRISEKRRLKFEFIKQKSKKLISEMNKEKKKKYKKKQTIMTNMNQDFKHIWKDLKYKNVKSSKNILEKILQSRQD